MLATVVVVVATHNLAFGVLTGVLIASLNFATKVARFLAVSSELREESRLYKVTGQVFFASADRFMAYFDFREAAEKVVIDVYNHVMEEKEDVQTVLEDALNM